MRVFAIVGILITVVIVGFVAAKYLNAVTAPTTAVPDVQTPYGVVGGTLNPTNVIDTTLGIASMDHERQREMLNMMDNIGGVNSAP